MYSQSRIPDIRNLAAQTHNADHIRIYQRRISNFSTARNVCIGAAAALYVWNLIDAIVAPGARRVVIKPSMDFGGYTMENRSNVGVNASFTF